MAKSKNRSVSTSRARRVAFDNASDVLSLLGPPALSRSGRSLLEVEDRRTFNPSPVRPARTLRKVTRLVLSLPAKSKAQPRQARPDVLRFDVPESTMVCVRRHRRKEVLHATGKAGGRVKRPRLNAWSKVSCKRR